MTDRQTGGRKRAEEPEGQTDRQTQQEETHLGEQVVQVAQGGSLSSLTGMKLPVRRQHSGGQGNTASGVVARKADVSSPSPWG